MRLFISGEVEGRIGDDFRVIMNSIEEETEGPLAERQYGSELVNIGVIPIIIDKETLDIGFFRERKLFKRKSQSADMRLQIDFEVFRDADMDKKRLLIIKNIIDSIRILDARAKKDFDGKRLESDILELLGVSTAEIDCL